MPLLVENARVVILRSSFFIFRAGLLLLPQEPALLNLIFRTTASFGELLVTVGEMLLGLLLALGFKVAVGFASPAFLIACLLWLCCLCQDFGPVYRTARVVVRVAFFAVLLGRVFATAALAAVAAAAVTFVGAFVGAFLARLVLRV
jgi:hypothetical protein